MSQRIDERRKAVRVELHCPALLRRNGDAEWTDDVWVLNISCLGLYCSAPQSFSPGEHLEMRFHLPELAESSVVELRCSVTVTRAQAIPGGVFGVGCVMDDYTITLAQGPREHVAVA